MKIDQLLHGGDYFPEQWLDHPEIIEEDIKFLKKSRSNAVSIGMFAWSAYEKQENVYDFAWLDEIMDLMAENNIKVMLATPSGARPAWMSEKYPEVLRTNSTRQKMLHGERHNHCFSSPYYRKKIQEINKLLAARYQDHPALYMWHVSNEYSGDCHCELCQEAFRDWLKNKYNNDLDVLNQTWWTTFWSHTYTSWSQIESPSPFGEISMHGLNLDWKRFVTDQTLSFYQTEIEPLKKITPNIPVFTNFQADNPNLFPFKQLNYPKFVDDVDVIAWNAYPNWHNDTQETYELASKVAFLNDYYKSLKQQPFLLTESTPSKVNWHQVNKAKRPGMHYLSAMQMFAHGSNSNLYFQVRKSKGASEKFHGAIIDHDRSSENRVFQDVKKLGERMEEISSEVVDTNRYAEVGILYDIENAWALEDAQGYGLASKKYDQTVTEHYQAFWEKNIAVDVITTEESFEKYKLLIVPMLYMMDERMLSKLDEYVKQGGTVVATYITGVVDENDLVNMGGWPIKLQEIFGIDISETDTLYPTDRNSVRYHKQEYEVFDYATIFEKKTATEIGMYQDDFYKNEIAVSENEYGEGKAYYIGARMEHAFQQDFYGDLIDEINLKPILDVDHEIGVSIQGRQNKAKDENIIFVMNFTEENQHICINDVTNDVLTGERITGELVLEKYEVLILKK